MGDSEEDYGWADEPERRTMEGIVEAKRFGDDGKKMTLTLKTAEGSRMYGVWLKDKTGGDTKLAFLKAANAGDLLDFAFKTREYQGKTYYDITDVGRHEAHKDANLSNGGLNPTQLNTCIMTGKELALATAQLHADKFPGLVETEAYIKKAMHEYADAAANWLKANG